MKPGSLWWLTRCRTNIQNVFQKLSFPVFQLIRLYSQVKWDLEWCCCDFLFPLDVCRTMTSRDAGVVRKGRQWGRTVEFWEHCRGAAGENGSQGLGGKHTDLLNDGGEGRGLRWLSPRKRLWIEQIHYWKMCHIFSNIFNKKSVVLLKLIFKLNSGL